MYQRIIALIIAMAMMMALIGCSDKEVATNEEDSYVPVSVIDVTKGSISLKQNYSSKAIPDGEAMIFPTVQGMVGEVFVEVGDTVNKDDVLFTIDRSDLNNQLKEAQKALEASDLAISMQKDALNSAKGSQHEQQLAQLEQVLVGAEVAYNNAKKGYEDTLALYEQRAVSEQQLTQAESSFKQAKAGYDVAKLNVELYQEELAAMNVKAAQTQLDQAVLQKEQASLSINTLEDTIDDTRVKSPISGIVTSVNVKENQSLNTNVVPVTVVNADRIHMEVGVSENLVKHLEVDQKVEVYISAASDHPFEGRIKNISIAANQQTSKFNVKVEIDNKDGEIYAGMFARVSFTSEYQEGIVVPIDAVARDLEADYVYVLNDEQKPEKRQVTTGINNGSDVVILDGLTEGEKLIVEGQHYIKDNSNIKVVEGE